MPEYKKNPIFNSEINKIQSHEPNIAFQYAWDNISGKWVPAPKDIEVVIPDIQTHDETTHSLLESISGQLDKIHVDVEIDQDTETHKLLSGIQGVLESQGEVDDTTTHGLLSGIQDILESQGEVDDITTHGLLSGIQDTLESQGEVDDTTTHGLLSGIQDILESQGEVDDTTTHGLLSGIQDILESQGEVGDATTHGLLSGIHVTLESQGQTNDEETHRILSIISDQIDDIDLQVDLTETNQNLEDVKEALEDLKIDVDVNVDDVQIDLVETNRILSGISGQDSTHYQENEKYLDGISGQDQTHYIENERLLKSIKDSAESLTLSVEELKRNYTDITYHIRKFDIDKPFSINIAQENTEGIVSQKKPFTEILHNCNDYDELMDRENFHEDRSSVILSEEMPDDDNIERIGDHDESAAFIIKKEQTDLDNDWFKFTPLAKPMGIEDRVTIYNDHHVPLEILFREGEPMFLYGGYSIELTKPEVYKMFVRKKYAQNGFSLGYTLERMYTPEKTLFNDIEEHPATLPQHTHQLLTLGSFMTDAKYLYVSYGQKIKRVAIASWEMTHRPPNMVYPIDYYDAYTEANYLYLNFKNFKKRIAITEWEDTARMPIDSFNKVWADENFLYVKIHGPKSQVGGYGGKDEWRRYAIAEYAK